MATHSFTSSLRLWEREADEHDGDSGANAVMPDQRACLLAISAGAADTSERPSWLDRFRRTGRA
jgi:hypothetical protein